MTVSIRQRSATPPRYAQSQRKRRALIAQGVESWLVSSTPDDRLDTLQLRLVPDVEAPSLYEQTGDEAASTDFFLRSLAAERCGVDAPMPDSWWFDGPGAA